MKVHVLKNPNGDIISTFEKGSEDKYIFPSMANVPVFLKCSAKSKYDGFSKEENIED